MGLSDWFERKANEKLRKSQIKILYQNQSAIEYLLSNFKSMQGSGMEPDASMLEAITMFEGFTDDCIVRLTWNTVLEETASPQLLEINNALKNVYSGLNEGTRRFRSAMGLPAGDIVPFANRFSPAAGWDRISDNEWDVMVKKSVSRLPKSHI